MNKIEKIAYNLLKKNPALKFFARNFYQGIFDLLPRKKDFLLADAQVFEGFFFGFHDLKPFSPDESKLLAHKVDLELRMPGPGDSVGIGFFSRNKRSNFFKDFTELARTKAWNYHKGARLQWLGKDNALIFNDSEDGKLISRKISLHSGSTTNFTEPIDTVSPDGKWATTFDYFRLEKGMPGYGYGQILPGLKSDAEKGPNNDFINIFAFNKGNLIENIPEKSGLSLLELKSGNSALLISLEELNTRFPDMSMADPFHQYHFITHSSFSPDGSHIAFLHRSVEKDVRKRRTQLVVVSLDGREIYISPTSGMVSHYAWNFKGQILAYCSINDQDSHVLFDDFTMKNYKRILPEKLNADGHQHFFPDGKSFITDTYPDRSRMAKIFHVDTEQNTLRTIASLNSPAKFQSPDLYRHWSCDLHPRVSVNGSYISFDSVHTGLRSLVVMQMPKETY